MRVVIVGAGIVGLSTAYALVKQGVQVTVVERGSIPNALASSSDHHRLIRSFYGAAAGYCARMPEAFAAWRSMWQDLPGAEARYYVPTGILAMSREPGDHGDRSRQAMEACGIEFERIDSAAEIARRFPFLDAAEAGYALFAEGGALMADRILTDLADWLRGQGADLRQHSAVTAIDPGGCVTLATGERLEADRVVVCAGVELPRLMPELANTLRPRRTLMVYAHPPEDLAEAWQGAPCWTGLGATAELWGAAPVAGLPLKLGDGGLGSLEEDDSRRAVTPEEIAAMLRSYAGVFKGIERFRLAWAQANFWTLAPEEKFLLRENGAVLAVSACSGHGFKFGALTGLDLMAAVTGAQSVDAVARRMAA